MPSAHLVHRRTFLQGSASAVAAGIAAPTMVRGGFFVSGSDRIRVGLVGCGGRGTGAAIEAVAAAHAAGDRGVVIAAMGDVVPTAIDESAGMLSRRLGDAFDAPTDRRFAGTVACERVCAAGIDVVILATPAGVRPGQVTAAVEGGLHVYAERPLAASLEGLAEVARAGRCAAAKGLSFVTSLALRYDAEVASAIDRMRSLGDRVREVVAVELSGGRVAERCVDAADAAMEAIGGHGDEWNARPTANGVAFRTADGRSIRIVFDASPALHGSMVGRSAGGSVEFITPSGRRRATASGLGAAWAALLGSIRRNKPINDSQEACRASEVMLSATVLSAEMRGAVMHASPLSETA